MPPFLPGVFVTQGQAEPRALAIRLLTALLLGWVVAWIYRRTNGGQATHSFRATLVLLTILIAAVTQVIGDNVARAFSLVGALSIVRFRTVVQDTRDTAFVIFAVTVGMAVGAGDVWVAGLSLLTVGVAAAALAHGKAAALLEPRFQLVVTLTLGYDAETTLNPVFERHLADPRVVAVATGNRGASIETTYSVRLKAGATPSLLVRELNEVEGVQGVQLRSAEGTI